MTMTLVGNGGLLERIGHLGGWQNDLFSMAGGPAATTNVLSGAQLPVRYAQVQADLAYSPVWSSLLDGYFASLVAGGQASLVALANQLAAIVTNLIISQANGDTPLLQPTLEYALQLLQTQMTGNYYLSAAGAAAGTPAAVGTPAGTDSAILLSTLRGDGLSLEYIYPETLTFRCVSDQYSGATLNQETFLVTGQVANTALAWPGGSAASLRMNMVDCASNPGGTTTTGNCLTNSNFQIATNTNIPDNWISIGGPIGTNVFCGTTNPWRAPNALCFTGTGGTAASIYQAFATNPSTTLGAGGTPFVLTPRTCYGFNAWVRVSATPTDGVLKIALTDGSGNILNNDAGNAQSFTKALTTPLSTTYVNIQHAFQTPTVLPAQARLAVFLSTDIDSGKSAYMGGFALTPLTDIYQQTYPQGPQVALFSGNVPTAVNDEYTSAITTGMALTTFGGLLEYILGIAQYAGVEAGLGIRLPSAGGTAVSDGLIA